MSRPIVAEVSLPSLRHNLARVRELAPHSKVWAVVKANAYGHGVERALQAFSEADGLALLEFDTAQRLRELGWMKPILMLEGAFEPEDARLASRLDLSLVVHRPDQLDWLVPTTAGATVPVYLKFNSGMNRLGMDARALRSAHAKFCASWPQTLPALMTHFANSDLPGGADEAIAAFDAACKGLPGERSLANSAAILAVGASHGDWVRPGVMLYGATPFADRDARSLGLLPAMRLSSRLIATQTLQPGDSVGYGARFRAQSVMRIGVVACGYADGYPRHAPTGTPILVDGVRTRTVGRVAMDMLMVDLTGVPQARIGSAVQLWGDQLSIDEVARSADTIGYELMCAVAPRVPVVTVS